MKILWIVAAFLAGTGYAQTPTGRTVDISGNATLANLPMFNARNYGATGNGTSDDTAAINSCIAATAPAGNCHLPVGTYRITAPLRVNLYGSLTGDGEGTVITADFAHWQSGQPFYAIQMVYRGVVSTAQITANRRISDFALIGRGNSAIQSWGIFESNTSNVEGWTYQLTNLSFDHLSIARFDTAVEAQDLVASNFIANSITNTRNGIVLSGNVVNINLTANQIQYASWSYTSSHTATNGVLLENNSKYTSGSEGTYPQGIYLYGNTILSYDALINNSRSLATNIVDNMLDSGAGGPAASGAGIVIGNPDLYLIERNYITSATSKSPVIQSSSTITNGWAIRNNNIGCYAGSGTGILFNGAGNSINLGDVSNNSFGGCTTGILFQQSMNYGKIFGNIGHGITNALINLSGSAGLSFSNVVIDRNVDADTGITVVRVGSATGYIMGTNTATGSVSVPASVWPNVGMLDFPNSRSGQIIQDDSSAGYNIGIGTSAGFGIRFWKGSAGTGTQIGQIDPRGNFLIGSGTNVVYRCTSAGTLPVGALTITASNCGATADTGLRVK